GTRRLGEDGGGAGDGSIVRAVGLGNSPRAILEELARIQSHDVVLPTATHGEIRLRCVAQPDAAQAALLDRLGIVLPKRMRLPKTSRRPSPGAPEPPPSNKKCSDDFSSKALICQGHTPRFCASWARPAAGSVDGYLAAPSGGLADLAPTRPSRCRSEGPVQRLA